MGTFLKSLQNFELKGCNSKGVYARGVIKSTVSY